MLQFSISQRDPWQMLIDIPPVSGTMEQEVIMMSHRRETLQDSSSTHKAVATCKAP